MTEMKEPVIVDAVRTPVGRAGRTGPRFRRPEPSSHGGELPPDTLARLQELWAYRAHPRPGEPPLSGDEATAFGWWFASAKFDDAWAVEQLKEALSRASDVDAYDMVLERLAALAAYMPADAVDCLRLLLERDAEGWRAFAFRDAQRTILRTALRSKDPVAKAKAEDVINRLGARGQWDFGELLREVQNETAR